MPFATRAFSVPVTFPSITPYKQRASVNVKSSLHINASMKAEDSFDFTIKSGN